MARTKIDLPETPSYDIPLPRVDVLERAQQNPFGTPAAKIELKDPQLVTHWCNTELKGGSQLQYFLESGYLKTRPEYLKNPDTFQFEISPDGYVVRGPRGSEILMYTTKAHVKIRDRQKVDRNLRAMRVTPQELAEAANKKFGSEAADYVSQHMVGVGGVRDDREVIHVDPSAVED